MASLKEIRGRIVSVTNTRKTTSAMKMVSSAKLRKAQDAILKFIPYSEKISSMIGAYLASGKEQINLVPLAEVRKVQRVALLVLSSNSSLCGSFNANVLKKLNEVLSGYSDLPPENISIYFIGKRAFESFKTPLAYTISGPYAELADKPKYADACVLTKELVQAFLDKKIDKVEIVYNKFKTAAVQIPSCDTLLPLIPQAPPVLGNEGGKKKIMVNYIIEPSPEGLLKALVPTAINLQLFGTVLNSYAAEHGARTTAMQIATENADDLISSLVLQYNKLRQGAITTEILDIVGGAEALR